MNNKVCFTEQVNSQFCSINLHTLFRNSINSQFTSISISTSIEKCKKKNADEISRIHRKSENQISTQLNFIFCTPRWISNPQNDSASARTTSYPAENSFSRNRDQRIWNFPHSIPSATPCGYFSMAPPPHLFRFHRGGCRFKDCRILLIFKRTGRVIIYIYA